MGGRGGMDRECGCGRGKVDWENINDLWGVNRRHSTARQRGMNYSGAGWMQSGRGRYASWGWAMHERLGVV